MPRTAQALGAVLRCSTPMRGDTSEGLASLAPNVDSPAAQPDTDRGEAVAKPGGLWCPRREGNAFHKHRFKSVRKVGFVVHSACCPRCTTLADDDLHLQPPHERHR